MAKKVNLTPNLRIDQVDLEQATHGYSDELAKEALDRTFKDFYPRVVEGFRVAVDAPNRVITVYNGVAADQNGQLVSNEESLATARSITLGGAATYFIEAEFSETLGDTDSRAFWDPTFDNGLDTSGDVIPDGRESSQNVATRKLNDWVIVDPPSTTAFEMVATPGTTKIPLAVVTVSDPGGGLQITAPTTAVARTCFARTYATAVTSIRVLNSKIFPDAFTARLGPGTANSEDISVIANDRESGILTLAAGTANVHDVGERVVDFVGTTLFIDERVLMDDATDGEVDGGGILASTAGDGRVRMFQGDTEAGYALSQDPAADTGESDIQIKNLKEQVDYLASQMLEMKFGSGTRDGIGLTAPPTSFAVTEHYSRTGGIVNARSNTVSVGDGVSTWGDYNTTTSGSAQAAIQGAIDALPASGGVIYVKAGTYTITATAISIVDKPVWFVGEGRDTTVIDATGAVSAIDFDTATATAEWSSMLRMDNLSVTYSGGFSGGHAMTCTGAGSRMMVKNCRIYGIDATNQVGKSTFEHCLLRQTTNGTASVLLGQFNECTFTRCFLDMDAATAALRAVELTASSTKLTFDDCKFSVDVAAVAMVEIASDTEFLAFNRCDFAIAAGVVAFQTPGGGKKVSFRDCNVQCTGGLGTFNGTDELIVSGCRVAVPQDGSAVLIDGSCLEVLIENSLFEQATTTALASGVAVDLTDISSGIISGNHFQNCDYGVYVWDVTDTVITDCQFTAAIASRGRSGIHTGSNASPAGAASFSKFHIRGCHFRNFDDPNPTVLHGIHLEGGVAEGSQVHISECNFDNIGDTAVATTTVVHLKSLSPTTTVTFYQASVTNCSFSSIFALTNVYGVWFENVRDGQVTNNNFRSIGTQTTTDLATVIKGTYVDNFIVTGNTIDTVGHASAEINGSVIEIGGDSQTTQNDTIIVSNNAVRNTNHDGVGTYHLLHVNRNAKTVSICGNVLHGGSLMDSAIEVEGSSVDAVNVGNVTIANNALRDFTRGINVEMPDTALAQKGAVSISGNSMEDCTTNAIRVTGGTSITFLISIAITGNTVKGIGSTTGAIFCDQANSITVSGNAVYSSSASGQVEGIVVRQAEQSCITGNTIRILSTHAAARGIRTYNTAGTASSRCLVASNQVTLLGGTAGIIGVEVHTSGTIRLFANFINVTGSGTPTNATNTQTQSFDASEMNNVT